MASATLAVASPPPGDSSMMGVKINLACQAAAQVLLVAGTGAWLARRRGFDKAAIAAVAGVNWHALTPALLFSSIVAALTPSTLGAVAPLVLLSLLHVLLGLLPALALGAAARLPRDLLFFTAMASCLPNCGNLPWLFMPALIRFFTPPAQAEQQVAYCVGLVSVYTIVVMLAVVTLPFLVRREGDAPPPPPRSPRSAGAFKALLLRCRRACWPVTASAPRDAMSLRSFRRHAGLLAPTTNAAGANGCTATASSDAAARPPPSAAAAPAQQLLLPPIELAERGGGGGVAAAAPAAPRAATPAPLGDVMVDVDADDDVGGAVDGVATTSAAPPISRNASESRSSSWLLRSFSSFSGGRRRINGTNGDDDVRVVWTFPQGWQLDASARVDVLSLPAPPASSWRAAAPAFYRGGSCGCSLPAPLRRVLAHPVFNLPLGAVLLGIACAAVAPVRAVLVVEQQPLHFLWLSLAWIGAAAAPLATIQMGAELVAPRPPQPSSSSTDAAGAGAAAATTTSSSPTTTRPPIPRSKQVTATLIAVVVKLVVVPLLGVALLQPAALGALLPAGDKVYLLLALVEGAMPASVTLMVVCSRIYPDVRPLSKLLAWQYGASMVTMPVLIVWFLTMIGA